MAKSLRNRVGFFMGWSAFARRTDYGASADAHHAPILAKPGSVHGGRYRTRTCDLMGVIHALYQLS
jgi:hypothetical protein